MNVIQQIRRSAVLLSIVVSVPFCAMENKEKKSEFKAECEILVYPEDAHIEVNNLPQGVKKMIGDNTFIVPIGMDAKLIHPTLIPLKRISDRPLDYKLSLGS